MLECISLSIITAKSKNSTPRLPAGTSSRSMRSLPSATRNLPAGTQVSVGGSQLKMTTPQRWLVRGLLVGGGSRQMTRHSLNQWITLNSVGLRDTR